MSFFKHVMETNMNESMDLLSIQQILYFLILGVLPSIVVYRFKIESLSFEVAVVDRLDQNLILRMLL